LPQILTEGLFFCYYSGKGRAGLKSALESLTKPLKAVESPPGSRFCRGAQLCASTVWPVTASARHGKAD